MNQKGFMIPFIAIVLIVIAGIGGYVKDVSDQKNDAHSEIKNQGQICICP